MAFSMRVPEPLKQSEDDLNEGNDNYEVQERRFAFDPHDGE